MPASQPPAPVVYPLLRCPHCGGEMSLGTTHPGQVQITGEGTGKPTPPPPTARVRKPDVPPAESVNPSGFVTQAGARKILAGISRETLMHLVQTDQLPEYRLAKQTVRYRVSDLLDFLKRRATKPTLTGSEE